MEGSPIFYSVLVRLELDKIAKENYITLIYISPFQEIITYEHHFKSSGKSIY